MTGPCDVPGGECENRILGGGGGAEVTVVGTGVAVVVDVACMAAVAKTGGGWDRGVPPLLSSELRGWMAPNAARSSIKMTDVAVPSAAMTRRGFMGTAGGR